MRKIRIPKPLDSHIGYYSTNELATMLKERIDLANENFYAEGVKWSVDVERRVIFEINILSAHFTAQLTLY